MPARISSVKPILSVVAELRKQRRSGPVLLAIDGRGGAGKSTFAQAVAAELPHASVLHTDDFAFGWDGGWDSDRFRVQVLRPILDGCAGRYQRYDWESRQLAEWHAVPVDIDALILEGVMATTMNLGDVWDVRVWVEAPASLRLSRGLERDGEGARDLWEQWMAREDAWIAGERPAERCDFIIDGAQPLNS